MQHVSHWDEVDGIYRDVGHLGATWRNLGRAVGTEGVGVSRIDVEPGRWSTPAHVEGASEEIFYVLEGSGLSWQDGAVYEIGPGDCLVHHPHAEAHTLRAGSDGLSVLAYGHRVPHGNTVLPRAGIAWMYPAYLDVTTIGGQRHPYNREADVGEPEVGEPSRGRASIVNVEDVEPYVDEHGDSLISDRDLGTRRGLVERTGLSHMTLVAGRSGLAAALSLGGGGDLRRPRGRRDAPPGRRVASDAAGAPRRAPARARGSRTRSAPVTPTSSTSRTARASRTTSPTTRARARSRCGARRHRAASSPWATGTASRSRRGDRVRGRGHRPAESRAPDVVDPDVSVETLAGVGPKVAERLGRLGIRASATSPSTCRAPTSTGSRWRASATSPRARRRPCRCTLERIRVRPTRRRNLKLVEGVVVDGAGVRETAVWFNQAYLAKLARAPSSSSTGRAS